MIIEYNGGQTTITNNDIAHKIADAEYNCAIAMINGNTKKSHVVLWYSDYKHGNEIKYFDTNKEAENYFNKLLAYAKQFDLPFIDFYSEQ